MDLKNICVCTTPTGISYFYEFYLQEKNLGLGLVDDNNEVRNYGY